MSLAAEKLQRFRVVDKRTDITEQRYYKIFQGGQDQTIQAFGANSYNQSAANFTVNTPSLDTIIDRLVWIEFPITITLSGPGSNTYGNNIISYGQGDAFRAFPIDAITNNCQVLINGVSVNIPSYQAIRHLMRFYDWQKSFTNNLSMFPDMLDQTERYGDALNSIRNPLANYFSSDAWSNPRGSFPVNIISNTTTQAVVQALITVPLFVSPFIWNAKDEEPGLIGIQNMQINYNFNSNFQQIWSHSDDPTAQSITNVQFGYYGQPQAYFTFINPRETARVPKSPVYSYYSFNDYPTSGPTVSVQGQQFQLTSNQIQLSSIPSIIYIMCRPADSSYTVTTTDTYAQPMALSLLFDNKQGLLSGADTNMLYNVSVGNGMNLSWSQWSQYTGGIIAVVPGRDFGLNPAQASGLIGKYTMAVQGTFKHLSSATIQYEMNILVASVLTIPEPGQAITQIGVLTAEDVLNAESLPGMSSEVVRSVYGGDFFGSLKNIFSNIKSGFNKVKPALKVAADIGELIPGASAYVKPARELLGVGMHKKKTNKKGGELISGRQLQGNLNMY